MKEIFSRMTSTVASASVTSVVLALLTAVITAICIRGAVLAFDHYQNGTPVLLPDDMLDGFWGIFSTTFWVAFLVFLFLIVKPVKDAQPPEGPIAEINDLSVGYLTQELYNDGDYAESSIASSAVFTKDRAQYMVIDFKIRTLADHASAQSVKVTVRARDNASVSTAIQEAATGKIETVESGDGSHTYDLFYAIPSGKGEEKNVRMILKLTPHVSGNIKLDIAALGANDADVTGKTETILLFCEEAPQ